MPKLLMFKCCNIFSNLSLREIATSEFRLLLRTDMLDPVTRYIVKDFTFDIDLVIRVG